MTAYLVKDRGLVVLTSWSHRGVSNTIRQAQPAAETDRLHAIIGGFHLVPPLTEDYVRRTVAELKAMNPDFLVPAHCAGSGSTTSPVPICPAGSSAPSSARGSRSG